MTITRRVIFTLVVVIGLGCYPKGLNIPLPYTVKANAGDHSMECVREELADLGFRFFQEPGEDGEIYAGRITSRTPSENRSRSFEFVRLKTVEEDSDEVFEVRLGRSSYTGPLDYGSSPPPDLFLSAPSRASIGEIDAVAQRCQGLIGA